VPNRLTQAIDFHGHLSFLYWLLEVAKPSRIVELGVFRGDSLATFSQATRELNLDSKIYGIDCWQGDSTTGNYGEEVYSVVKDYFDSNCPNTTLIRAYFDEALQYFEDQSIDILHIDGLHTYEACKHDFETWLPKLSKKSIVLMHDTEVVSDNFGVHKFWQEVSQNYPAFTFNHSNGLGVVLVGPEQPAILQQLCSDHEELDNFKAVFEAVGGKFFQLAKAKHWQKELENYVKKTSLTMISRDALHNNSKIPRLLRSIKNYVSRH
tara:strand:- start:1724 stop:2518 length:795 start_codon:yes stop_codon:yes gene_type:complete